MKYFNLRQINHAAHATNLCKMERGQNEKERAFDFYPPLVFTNLNQKKDIIPFSMKDFCEKQNCYIGK